MYLAVSLEDLRRNRYLTVEEFAKGVLQVSPNTYYRLLQGRAEVTTMRKIAGLLGKHPAEIAEFAPPPSSFLLSQIAEGIDAAERDGWIELDPETLMPTGKRVREPFPGDEE
jgi:transcriptional regulator with XRE-family HTH domain